MVTVRRNRARLSTPRGTTCSLSSTWSHDFSFAAIAFDFNSLNAGIAGALVTPRFTFMVLALQRFIASVIAWRALGIATFLVARVPPAIPQSLTLDLTSVDLGALNLLRLGAAAARFIDHLVALGTSASMTSLRTSVSATNQSFSAGVAARRRSFGAGEIIAGLAAGAKPRLRKRACGTGPLMTNQIAIVESTTKFLAANCIAIPKRICAGSMFLRLSTIARLYAGSRARRTFARMTVVFTLVLVAVKGFAALVAACPGPIGASPHGGLAVAAVTPIFDGLWAGRAWPGVAQNYAFVVAARQPSPAFLAA